MSGVIFEDEEEEGGLAELERILEESGEDDEEIEEEMAGDGEESEEDGEDAEDDAEGRTKLPLRPLSALPFGRPGTRRRSIHWNDETQVVPSSNGSSSATSPRSSSPTGSAPASPSRPPPPSRGGAVGAAIPGTGPLSAVTSFRRSLKLLGLQPRELGLPDQPPAPPSGNSDRRSRSPGPTFTTRIRSRSVSLDDLRAAARQGALTPDTNKDGDVYRMISSAVYEEWYFRKQQELTDRKRREQEQERKAAEEMEKRKVEMQMKSQDKFQEWLREKTRQMKNKVKESGNGKRQAMRAVRVVTPERAERAFQEWKRGKEQQQQQQQQQQQASGAEQGRNTRARALPAKHEQPDSQARREEAEKAYELWKKRTQEERREEEEKRKRREEKRKQEAERKEKERKEMNEKSFERWKSEKEQQLKKKEEKARRKEEKKDALELEKRQQRQYEAQQAFLVWLDDVEGRETMMASSASSRLLQDRRQRGSSQTLSQTKGTTGSKGEALDGLSFRPARRHSYSD